MKIIRNILNTIIKQIKKSINNNIVTPSFLVVLSIVLSVLIWNDTFNSQQERLVLSLVAGCITSLLIYLSIKNKTIVNSVISLFISLITYLVFSFTKESIYIYLGYTGIILIELITIIYLLLIKDNKKAFAYIASKLLYIVCLCTVLMIGITVVIVAFSYLIYSDFTLAETLLIAAVFIYLLIGGTLLLSYLDFDNQELEIPRYYHNIFNFALLIVYYLLLAVLYAYIIKIIFTRTMPVGQMNWFASIALALNIFFYLSTEYEESGIARFHHRFGGIILFPIFIFQQYAISIRVSAYGLTVLRYASILFNIVGVSFIIESLIKRKTWIYILICAILVAGFITPFNIIDVPTYNQQNILKETLIRNNMFDDYKIIPNSNISDEDKQIIKSAYDYLKYEASDKLKFDLMISFEELFGFDVQNTNYIYCSYNRDERFVADIKDYSKLEVVNEYVQNMEVENIDVSDLAMNLYKQYGEYGTIVNDLDNIDDKSADAIYIPAPILTINEQSIIIFDEIYFSIENNEIKYFGYHGYKLTK